MGLKNTLRSQPLLAPKLSYFVHLCFFTMGLPSLLLLPTTSVKCLLYFLNKTHGDSSNLTFQHHDTNQTCIQGRRWKALKNDWFSHSLIPEFIGKQTIHCSSTLNIAKSWIGHRWAFQSFLRDLDVSYVTSSQHPNLPNTSEHQRANTR